MKKTALSSFIILVQMLLSVVATAQDSTSEFTMDGPAHRQTFNNNNTATNAQNMAGGYNQVMSQMLTTTGSQMIASGYASTPTNMGRVRSGMAMVALGGLFGQQGRAFNAASGVSFDSGQDVAYVQTATEVMPLPAPLQSELSRTAIEAEQARAELQRLGFNLRGDGSFITPDGTVVTPDAINNPGAAGLDSNAIGAANQQAAQASAALDKKLGATLAEMLNSLKGNSSTEANQETAERTVDGLGGGSAGAAVEEGGEEGAGGGVHALSAEARRKIASESVKGLSKQYGDSMIGVANDNIFQMMSRRYNLKQKQNYFLAPNE